MYILAANGIGSLFSKVDEAVASFKAAAEDLENTQVVALQYIPDAKFFTEGQIKKAQSVPFNVQSFSITDP